MTTKALWVLIFATAVWCILPSGASALTWEFDTDGDTEGWRTRGDAYDGGGNSTDLTVEEGILKVPVEKLYNIMVRLVSPRLELDAALYDRLIIRFRTSERSVLGGFTMNWMPGDAPTAGPTARLHGRQVMASTFESKLWTEEWQDFQFTGFVDMNGWDGPILRIGLIFGFREENRDKVPDDIWIDSITLTGIGAERMGDPAKVFYERVTGSVFRVAETYKVDKYFGIGASGDVDGDGDMDLILPVNLLAGPNATLRQSRIDVLFSRGDGTFETPKVYDTGSERFGPMHLTDIDGDGDLDLLGVDGVEGRLLVFPNAGDGRFMKPISRRIPFYSAERGWATLWVGDLDGDDDPDLAMSVGSVETDFKSMFWVQLNRGDGTFSDPDTYSLKKPGSAAGADVDGDGDVDLLVRSIEPGLFGPEGPGQPPPDAVYVLRNDGSGGFGDIRPYPIGSKPVGLVAADFDGDRDLDLGATNVYSDQISFLFNKGDGTFVTSAPYPVGHEPDAVCTGDFDGDGHVDLAVAHRGDVNVWVLRGVGDGTFSKEGIYPLTGSPGTMLTDDFNGDGHLDLAVADVSGSNLVMLFNRTSEEPTVVDEGKGDPSVPELLTLHPNYPNPFNSSTTVRYDLPFADRVRLCIYDLMGQRIRTLVDGPQQAGSHQVVWDGRDDGRRETASGIYICRLEVGDWDGMLVGATRMVLLR